MTPKMFYDWQTNGGTDDVMRLVACLEKADIITDENFNSGLGKAIFKYILKDLYRS